MAEKKTRSQRLWDVTPHVDAKLARKMTRVADALETLERVPSALRDAMLHEFDSILRLTPLEEKLLRAEAFDKIKRRVETTKIRPLIDEVRADARAAIKREVSPEALQRVRDLLHSGMAPGQIAERAKTERDIDTLAALSSEASWVQLDNGRGRGGNRVLSEGELKEFRAGVDRSLAELDPGPLGRTLRAANLVDAAAAEYDVRYRHAVDALTRTEAELIRSAEQLRNEQDGHTAGRDRDVESASELPATAGRPNDTLRLYYDLAEVDSLEIPGPDDSSGITDVDGGAGVENGLGHGAARARTNV